MMTAEQEYIITEEELSRLEGQAEAKYDCDPSEVCENVRSRSHTAPLTQAPCGSNPGECIIKMDKQVKEARQDEREKVLEMLNKRKTLNKKVYISNPEMKELGKIRIEEIDGIIESLRAGKDGEA